MTDKPTSQFSQLLRHDFYGFVHRSFLELNPQTPFLPNWHIELMAAKLEEVRLGKIRRLIINIPPRHLKSHAASIAFVAWMLGHSPSYKILCASYAQDLSEKLARDCRRLMTSPFYRALFKTRLSEDRQAVADFETTAGGGRFSSSVTGGTTGRGGDLIMIDDPLKPDDAYSNIRRESVNDWYDNTLFSRLNDKESGAIVLIMQRLHAADLVAHVLKKEPWEVISFPAIATERQTFDLITPFGARKVIRNADEALHAHRESRPTLDTIRRSMGEAKFEAQYQQTPVPPGGIYVKPQWFKIYAEPPANPDFVLQSWDTASKVEDRHDFSACTTWAIVDKHAYLLEVLCEKLEFPDLKRAVEQQNTRFSPDMILIEDSASGTALIQQLREDGLSNITAVNVKGDKEMRFAAQTPKIESGFIHIPKEAHWLFRYISELTAFPNAEHDDQVDSTTHALEWLSSHSSFQGWINYYNELAKGGDGTKPKEVRVKLPPGQFQLTVPPHLVNGGGPPVEVSEEAAEQLCRMGGVRVE